MAFAFKTAARVRKHEPKTTLARRGDNALPFIDTIAIAGDALLLDTCVYIDQMQGKIPNIVSDLLDVRIVNHSTVALQELMYTVGVLNPNDARSDVAIKATEKAINAMPPHRTFAPDTTVLATAAVYAGILCRTQNYAKDARMKALNDCILFLQAMKLGFSVLTRNAKDFDLMLQMRPDGRVLFYRTP